MVWSKFRSRTSLQSGLMGLCGCNLKEKLECSNGIHDGKNWHQIRISRSGERQKICRIVAMKIRGNILCSGKLDGLCCWWNAYHQNLDMIDEMKHLPWAWKPFTIVLFFRRRAEVCCLSLVTAAVSRYYSKTVRIFASSSTREQSNKRSGTRLKTESETGKRR